MGEKIKIVTWKWDSGLHPKKVLRFTADHVNILWTMLFRNLDVDFELICITDDEAGIRPEVKVIPLWSEFEDTPGCFRRLKVFSKEMKDIIGPRFVSIDLDVVIVDDVTDIFMREEDFIVWGEHWRKTPYCGSFFIMDAGCRDKVYRSFNPDDYIPGELGKFPYGTDQDHICCRLYPEEAMLTSKDGVYAFNFSARRWKKGQVRQLSKYKNGRYFTRFFELGGKIGQFRRPFFSGDGSLPDNAKMIFFNGKYDPSQLQVQKEYSWVRQHWTNRI